MVKQYTVRISQRAQDSLDRIVEYLSETQSFSVAYNVERQLLEAAQTLKTFPQGYGKLKTNIQELNERYRFLSCKKYKIIYAIEEEPLSLVIVVDLIHDSMSTQSVEASLTA